jgi:hypothetical protein
MLIKIISNSPNMIYIIRVTKFYCFTKPVVQYYISDDLYFNDIMKFTRDNRVMKIINKAYSKINDRFFFFYKIM